VRSGLNVGRREEETQASVRVANSGRRVNAEDILEVDQSLAPEVSWSGVV
jgi:hypothetical protein